MRMRLVASRTVASHVICCVRHLLDQARAGVQELVFEVDVLRHGDTVLGDLRPSIGLLDKHVAALKVVRDPEGSGVDHP
eukprot:6452867-Pyramimonas_sp.AAC.1